MLLGISISTSDQKQGPAHGKRKARPNHRSFSVKNSLESGVHQRTDPELRRGVTFPVEEPLFESGNDQ